ncbi:hypothetical protein QR77_23225 [Streptomyces sp. 150FB]|uniref:hypothetical protein n=1 Tax=Streptomyces sp. 150FB TaxID=1576605 RepID=UPI0005891A63|nr:hypothetical protein [Streptomyces sp. 150FB]KIF79094.1 hypothetical protein QR77_23225 [Streptomyces sp. 150FB]
MAFGADELRVLRRALAVALHPAPLPDEDVRACLGLAESVDEAVREAGRLRAFLRADLARYRAALPGSLTGYLELLQDALTAGYQPVPDDLAALRALRGNQLASVLLDRCERLAERSVRARLAGRTAGAFGPAPALAGSRTYAAQVPRMRLHALPGGRAAADEPRKPDKPDRPVEPRRPTPPGRPEPGRPDPDRPMPKPSEVFPPRRRPKPPPEHRAAG